MTGEPGPGYGRYVEKVGFKFEAYMTSGETLLNTHEVWQKIPEFHLRVKTYLGEV